MSEPVSRTAGAPAAAEAIAQASASPDDTEALGAALAEALEPGDRIGLVGPLGSGKTRFVRGLARGLSAQARVRSPTFTLVNEYPGRIRLAHVDLYRLDDPDPAALGFDELAAQGAVVVEWADRLTPSARRETFEIVFESTGETDRRLIGSADGARAQELLRAWRALGLKGERG